MHFRGCDVVCVDIVVFGPIDPIHYYTFENEAQKMYG